jgi:hypothetical protein
LAIALTTPKLTMKETTIVVEAILNSSAPISGTTRPLQPYHATDECIDQDQEGKLPPVLAQAKPNIEGSGG